MEKNNNYILIAIVAIVAIVGLVGILSDSKSVAYVEETDTVSADTGNIGGQAYGMGKSSIGSYKVTDDGLLFEGAAVVRRWKINIRTGEKTEIPVEAVNPNIAKINLVPGTIFNEGYEIWDELADGTWVYVGFQEELF